MDYNVFLSNTCNLNCRFCSASVNCTRDNVPEVPSYEDDDLAELVLRTGEKHDDRDVTLFLFGGEPMPDAARIEALLDCMDQKLTGFRIRPVVFTNGLMPAPIPDPLLKRLSLVICTINYARIPDCNLRPGYFSTIVDNVRQIRESTPVCARFTVTEQTSLYAVSMLTEHFFDYINWQINNVPSFRDYAAFYATYTYEVELLFTLWLNALQKGILLNYLPFMAALRLLLAKGPAPNNFCCGFDRQMLFVQTDGHCYSCCDRNPGGVHSIGSVANGISFSGLTLDDLRCGGCPSRALCLGRCGKMHRQCTEERVDEYCRLNQPMFDLFLRNETTLRTSLFAHPELERRLYDWVPVIIGNTP